MKKIPGHAPKLGNFVENTEPQQITGATLGDTESRGELEGGAICQRPGNCGRNVMRCAIHAEVLVSAETAIHLQPDLNILRTEIASFGSRLECKWTAESNGIA